MSDDSNVFNILKDLQPIAFLLSACIVIAAFYINSQTNVDKVNLTNVLMAFLFFFFAYIGLFVFRSTNFLLFLYFGESFLVVGFFFIFAAFIGIAQIIDGSGIATNGLYLAFCQFLFWLIVIIYLLGKVKNKIVLDFCKMFFHLSFFLFCLFIAFFLLNLQSTFQVPNSMWTIANEISIFLWITLKISLYPLVLVYSWGFIPFKINDLFSKLKNEGILNINPALSIEAIVPSMIGTWLLIDTTFMLLGVKIGLITVMVLIVLFIAGFCLTWRREIIARLDKP